MREDFANYKNLHRSLVGPIRAGLWVRLELEQRHTFSLPKNIVAAGLADRCEIQVSYAIGVSEPTSISIDTFGTGRLTDDEISNLVREHFDLRPRGLMEMLDLHRPIYKATAAYGHFGREEESFSWEKTDKVALLKKAL